MGKVISINKAIDKTGPFSWVLDTVNKYSMVISLDSSFKNNACLVTSSELLNCINDTIQFKYSTLWSDNKAIALLLSFKIGDRYFNSLIDTIEYKNLELLNILTKTNEILICKVDTNGYVEEVLSIDNTTDFIAARIIKDASYLSTHCVPRIESVLESVKEEVEKQINSDKLFNEPNYLEKICNMINNYNEV